MQLSIPVKALRSTSSGFNTKGGTLTSPLILAKNPDQPLEAASKSYVDNRIVSIPAASVDSGVLSAERFPQFNGDVTKGLGSAEIYLSATGVEAGTYSKVNVNDRGRVTAAYSLSGDDIPSLNWSKIKTNTPVSYAGYGITNGLPKIGGNLTGFLSLNLDPTQSLHAANKLYVDNVFSSNAKYEAGDVVRKPTSTTPTGFLRANGGEVSKSTYSALYAVIGEAFSTKGNIVPGAGRPWEQQYEINTTQTGDITWANSAGFSWYLGTSGVMLKDKIHILYVNNTESMGTSGTVNADGTITWGSATTPGIPLPPGSRLHTTFVVAYSRLFMIGGYDNGVGSRTDTYSAAINADGSIGSWIQGPALLTAVHGAKVVITKNRMYVIGGETSAEPVSRVQTITIGSSGFTGSWNVAPSLPVALADHSVAVVKNRIYVFGGNSGRDGYRNTVYMTEVGIDGVMGNWVQTNPLPVTSAYNLAFVVNSTVYLMVGYNGTTRVATMYRAAINADGTLGDWTLSSPLHTAIGSANVYITGGKVTILGTIGNDSSYTASTGTITGGFNDYSGYYDGSIVTPVSTTFRLPDYTNKEVDGFKYFIKH